MVVDPSAPFPGEPAPNPALDVNLFAETFAPEARGSRHVAKLHELLVAMDSTVELVPRLDWLERLAFWLHNSGTFGVVPPVPGGPKPEEPRTARLLLLMRVFREVRPFTESFARLLSGILLELRSTNLFVEVGIPVEPGFWREAVDRIASRFLPKLADLHSLGELLDRLFPTEVDARWLERAPADVWEEFYVQLELTSSPPSRAFGSLGQAMAEAIWILASRTGALGLASDIRARLPEYTVADLPFLKLQRACEGLPLVGAPRGAASTMEEAVATIDACRAAVHKVREHVEEFGVSVDLVYRLELILAKLSRIEELLGMFTVTRESHVAPNIGRFLFELFQAQREGRSLRALVRTSAHVMARKIAERTGKTGEHYITSSRSEWRMMLLSAAGGGFLTAFTAALKFVLGRFKLPAFFAGLSASLNYAGSFQLMSMLGFTLATKQPSMTASALAAALEAEDQGDRGADRLATLTAQIARSQFAAALGNIGMVIPTSIGFDYAHAYFTGHSFLAANEAAYVLASMHPLTSATVFYAALTGVLLWCSSLAAGWLENWVAYRRIPEALAKHRRLVRIFGAARAQKIGAALDHGTAAFGGNVALGVLLGMLPILGTFFGLPLDVRHVTLSSGSLALAGCTLGLEAVEGSAFIAAGIGVGIIGMLNFGVSFVLALAVALRARGTSRPALGPLIRAFFRHVFRSPLEFVFPPRAPPASKRIAGSH